MALLLRFLLAVFPPPELLGALEGVKDYSAFWVQLAAVLAVLSMTLGNVLALVQTQHQAPAGLFDHRARRATS